MGSESEIAEGEIVEYDPKAVHGTRSFAELTREERQEMARRSHESRRRHLEAKALAKLEVYTQAHRELASQILGTKMTLLDGLVGEMVDPDTNQLDTTRLDKDRMKILLGLLDQLQKTAFPTTTKIEHGGSVDVRHVIAEISKGLQRPDDV